MTYEKRVKPFIQHLFTSSAERAAHRFLPSDLGDQVLDLETGAFYIVQGGLALLELGTGTRELTVGQFRNAAGDVLDLGTSPSFDGTFVTWAPGVVDTAEISLGLPSGLDETVDIVIPLDVFSGATDPASFSIDARFDGGAPITIEADDDLTLSGTLHRITATITADNVPADAAVLTLVLTPATHATDPINLAAQAQVLVQLEN